MIASAHIVAGIAIGSYRPRSKIPTWLALIFYFVTGVISHCILDFIPHGDYAILRLLNLFNSQADLVPVVILECLIIYSITWKTTNAKTTFSSLPIMVAVAGSALPDIKFLKVLNLNNPLLDYLIGMADLFHDYFHSSHHPPISLGIISEISIIYLCLYLIRFNRNK